MDEKIKRDTSQAVEEIYINKIKQKTDIERALMGFSMFETARLFVKSSLDINTLEPKDLKIEIFNRFYASDFDQQKKDKILQYLKNN